MEDWLGSLIWVELKSKCWAHGMACFEHMLFTCEKWMPFAAFAIGLLFIFLSVTLWYLDNVQLFKGQIHRWNNNKMEAPPLFRSNAKGWAWRNVTTLRLIDRAMDATTGHPLYQNNCLNPVLRLCSVCLHLQCLQTLEKNKLIFWVVMKCDSWTKVMRHL